MPRIPALPPVTEDLADDDLVVVYNTSETEAQKGTLTQLKEYIKPLHNPYCFGAWDSDGTVLTDGVSVKVDMNEVLYDPNSDFASGTYTVPLDGVYHFDFTWTMGTIASGVNQAAIIYKNGVEHKQGSNTLAINSGASVISCDLLLDAGDTIEFYAFQNSAGNEGTQQSEVYTWCNGHLVHAI